MYKNLAVKKEKMILLGFRQCKACHLWHDLDFIDKFDLCYDDKCQNIKYLDNKKYRIIIKKGLFYIEKRG